MRKNVKLLAKNLANKNVTNHVTNLAIRHKLANKNATNHVKKLKIVKLKQNATTNINMKVAITNIN